MTEYARAESVEYPSDIPQFSRPCESKKCLKDNKHNNFHLARAKMRTENICAGRVSVPQSSQIYIRRSTLTLRIFCFTHTDSARIIDIYKNRNTSTSQLDDHTQPPIVFCRVNPSSPAINVVNLTNYRQFLMPLSCF